MKPPAEQLGFDLGPTDGQARLRELPAVPVRELPDGDARAAIAGRELDENLLVEAGAGSGKTTQLVERMVALVREDRAEVHEIAAVTFTRKAAGELRQRFQEALERARLAAPTQSAERDRLERALQDLDRAFMGTIHAFCARLLRERPLDAGIDPAFAETTAAEAAAFTDRFWSLHLERLATTDASILGELEGLGLAPAQLRGLYEQLTDFSDVEFPLEPTPPPDPGEVATVRTDLEALLLEAERIMPQVEPEGPPDKMRPRVLTLLYHMRHGRWRDDRYFLDVLGRQMTSWELTQYKWADDATGKAVAKRLCERFDQLVAAGGTAERVLDQWWTHRYPTAMRFAKGAADALREHRRTAGRLDFQDLLELAAKLLRSSPAARADLGRRWRRLLVDEFQDTDPLQAEVLFLLASDAEDDGDWTRSVPRPGALFVVGDPKQSIYRFRRADIALYTRVRERFERFGRVLTLTSNFRSGPPIAALVNDVFAPPRGFPAQGDESQARFASLDPQPRAEPAPREDVLHYTVPVQGRVRNDVVAAWESDALAEWVATRVASGERRAGDFLILTRKKDPLAPFARALEARGLAVQVSGAGVGVEDEVEELKLLLRALTDPSDASLTVAVLIGLFFGLDHEQLLAHKEMGRGFDLRWADVGVAHATDPVEAALACMRGWWDEARRQPADVVVGRIAQDLGLLAHAAAGELGSIRAGALAFVLDAVRAAGLAGDTSITGALEALDAALGEEEAEAPLEPGRRDVIRLMNLHKAKGLEANVVVLAAPYGKWKHRVKRHVARMPDGRARGWLVVEEEDGWDTRTIARPRGWAEKAAREAQFLEAEELRLLYVAATRAGHELVVSRLSKGPDSSSWGALEPWLAAHAQPLDLTPVTAPARAELDVSPVEIERRIEEADAARQDAGKVGFAFTTVTKRAKEAAATEPAAEREVLPPLTPTSTGPGGYEWGSAVHALLEAAARGATAERLRALGRSLLLELDRPSRGGEPTELGDLMATVQTVRKSEIWRRAAAAPHRLAEFPFAVEEDTESFVEGVVDLAFRETDGWVLVDYKTDNPRAPGFEERRHAYRAQLRGYGDAWTRLTGEPVKERVILWTRLGQEEAVAP
jgi:ATP-dependent helicase/nuclease subunit A